jgi:RNA polymerase sigma factor (sigma-70 family)
MEASLSPPLAPTTTASPVPDDAASPAARSASTATASPGSDEAASAARALYELYERPVLRYCLSRLRSRDEAEDATQTTFLRAFTALQRGVVPEFAPAWLFKIAHNVCLSQRLRVTRRARVETLSDFHGAEPAARETVRDELFDLDDALAAMPVNLRTPLLLREWQGLSYNEIASALGTSHSAVETLLFRARRYLANALTDAATPAR